jgi:hypothetical protein
MCKILEKKNIQTEPSNKANDFAQMKPTVNIEKWVSNLSPAQKNCLLSTLLKQTQSNKVHFKKPFSINLSNIALLFISSVIYRKFTTTSSENVTTLPW